MHKLLAVLSKKSPNSITLICFGFAVQLVEVMEFSLKAYFHYGCVLRCVALHGERNRDADSVSISLVTQRNATRSRNGNTTYVSY